VPAADTQYLTAFGNLDLLRYPTRPEEPLQAWCAADTLLLEHIHALGLPGRDLLVVNDEHGALCVALQASALWSDSALSGLALKHNLERNKRRPIPLVWSTSEPFDAAANAPALVVMRVPKQLPLFEYQLGKLAATLAPGARVVAAGMDKHLSARVASLLEHYIGPTQRHRGQRKARVFSCVKDQRRPVAAAATAAYYCQPLGVELIALPGVFSRDKLDIGSRLLLEQLDALAPAHAVVDLACGNGVLGLAALQRGLCQTVSFCDESAMAIESARRNAQQLFPARSASCHFHHGDGLLDYAGPAPDLILCNPPFHLNHAVDEYAGRRLLAQCGAQLQPGGRLCLVANRHLNYLPTLKRRFQRVEKITQNSKFIIWLAERI
jgi:23S rRNA (guanine1835-N2)-methyltransferase